MKQIRLSITALSLLGLFFTSCTQEDHNNPVPVVVNAGSDQTILLPANSITLTGTVTSGLTPNTTYLWSTLTGPGSAVITTNSAATTTVTGLVAGEYVFQFQATNNAGAIGKTKVAVSVNTPGSKTITIQPGAATGHDAEVISVPGLYDATDTYGTDGVLRISDWTYAAQGSGEGWERGFIKFTALDTLPAGAVISSARLTLYGMSAATCTTYGFPEGDNSYQDSPYPLTNELWLQRATADWNQSTISYANQPAVTTVDEVSVSPSVTQFDDNVTNLDVTQLVKDMLATPNTNFGFSIVLQTEAYYRSRGFNSSESLPDSSNGPKLIVTYQ